MPAGIFAEPENFPTLSLRFCYLRRSVLYWIQVLGSPSQGIRK